MYTTWNAMFTVYQASYLHIPVQRAPRKLFPLSVAEASHTAHRACPLYHPHPLPTPLPCPVRSAIPGNLVSLKPVTRWLLRDSIRQNTCPPQQHSDSHNGSGAKRSYRHTNKRL